MLVACRPDYAHYAAPATPDMHTRRRQQPSCRLRRHPRPHGSERSADRDYPADAV